jgi:hypothetical protein
MPRRSQQVLVYQAIQDFVRLCLLDDKSLLWPDRTIWTAANVAEVKRRVVETPDVGAGSFESKLQDQMEGASPELWAIIADSFYVYYLPSDSITLATKQKQIEWARDHAGMPPLPDSVWEAQRHGFTTTGYQYNKKVSQIWLILLLAHHLKHQPDPAMILADAPRFQETIDTLLNSIENPRSRATDMRHALLFMLFPDHYERIISTADKKGIVKTFGGQVASSLPSDVDAALLAIRQALEAKYGAAYDYYEAALRPLWRGSDSAVDPPEDSDQMSAGHFALAEPFSKLFADEAEAEWAFEFLAKALSDLGVRGQDDLRVVISQPRYSVADAFISLTFGNWHILSFWAANRKGVKLSLTLVGEPPDWPLVVARRPFPGQSGDLSPAIYWLPAAMVRPMDDSVVSAFRASLTRIAEHFQHWERSPFRKHHVPELLAAVWDRQKRTELLRTGLAKPTQSQVAEGELPEEAVENVQPVYSLAQFAADTSLDKSLLARWVRALQRKGQVIIYGPPGTGKTYVAERLARYLIGGGDGFIELVQFHPGYAYEDFIQGLRPQANGAAGVQFALVPGRFLAFCQRAQVCEGPSVLIVDEFNRANLSQVMGELMYLLEYREREVPLAGGGTLRIPSNVFLIGTMNTADRSIALVDHALRRRFAFLALYPNYDILRRYHAQTGFEVSGLVVVLEQLNQRIGEPHYTIGTSFFLVPNLTEQIEDIWTMEIEPYLEEYFFDQSTAVDEFRWDKVRARILT